MTPAVKTAAARRGTKGETSMEQLLTRWGRELDRDLPLNDYPRPQMRRDSFLNLNGWWDYAIYPKEADFGGWQGKIVVPFSPETILSGVNRTVTKPAARDRVKSSGGSGTDQ